MGFRFWVEVLGNQSLCMEFGLFSLVGLSWNGWTFDGSHCLMLVICHLLLFSFFFFVSMNLRLVVL